MLVEPATREDYAWIAKLWNTHHRMLGGSFDRLWDAHWKARRTTVFNVVRPERGVQYWRVAHGEIYDHRIVVAVPRQGVARALFAKALELGIPVRNAIHHTNAASIALNVAMGGRFVGMRGKTFVVYVQQGERP